MKIAIVGANPDTYDKVPPLGPEWEVWRFSRANFEKPPAFNRWFELHHPRNYARYERGFPGYENFIKTDPRVVHHRVFPFKRLLDEFGYYFFQSGQAPWMLAYALTLNPDTIGMWGVSPGSQYGPQRFEVQHFVQLARDRGIEVIAPEDNILEHYPLYALEEDFGKHATMKAIFNPVVAESRRLASKVS